MNTKLAVTCGDPAGVGPEVIAKWLESHVAEAADVAVIGPARGSMAFRPAPRKIGVGLEDFAADPGTADGEGALVAWAALERAAAGCRNGEFCGVVTAPVSKQRLARIGYPHPGTDGILRGTLGRRTDDGVLRRQAAGGPRDLARAASRGLAAARSAPAAPQRGRGDGARAGGRHCEPRASASADLIPTPARAGCWATRSAI